MHTEADLDQMLVEHDRRHGEANDALLGAIRQTLGEPAVHDDHIKVALRPERRPDLPYGSEPRKNWPTHTRGWTPELVAERRYWVRKFMGEGLAHRPAAALIGVHYTTVRADALAMKLQREPGNHGKGGVKQHRQQERRERVRQLHEQNLGVLEIAEKLRAHETTIRGDLAALGLGLDSTRRPNRQATTLVAKAITAMDDMAKLLNNLPELEILQVDETQAQEWAKQLRRISKATGLVRKTMKGT